MRNFEENPRNPRFLDDYKATLQDFKVEETIQETSEKPGQMYKNFVRYVENPQNPKYPTKFWVLRDISRQFCKRSLQIS